MMYVLLATGFTGAWTLLFVWRWLRRKLGHLFAVAVFFSPKGGCTEAVVKELQSARHEIQVLAYSFTSKPIAQALVDAKLRGVHVEIVLDHSNEKEEYTDLHFFLEQGLTPLVDPHHAIAHNKVMIIDRATVITGSFNFTSAAQRRNAENLLVIHRRELAIAYAENFARRRAVSVKYVEAP